ncbi:MAG: OmpH family outer membrane protein [Planctomycetaceae bacterium]|nr:OmpH family outer membrane protein [Planctomycetaceae bacterium]
MKQSIISFVLVFGFAAGAYAQQAAAPAAPADAGLPTMVAVVDVAQLIKAHPDFKAKQEALQAKIKQADGIFQERQKKIQDKQKALEASQLKPGTPEHQRQLDEITNDLADFEKDAKQQQRKLALENSRIMYETYQDIKQVVKAFCMKRRIAQVTDYRSFEPNPAEPQSVAEDMDQKLVWFDDRLDITRLVIRDMYTSRGLTVPSQTAAAPAAQPVR